MRLPQPADALHQLLRGTKVGGGLQLFLIRGYLHRSGPPPVLQVPVDFAATGQRPPQAVQVAHPGNGVAWDVDSLLFVFSDMYMAEEWHILDGWLSADGRALLEVQGTDT